MEEVVVLLVLFAGITDAFLPVTNTECNVTQNTSTCSVSLGGSVYIQLMANASGHQLRCKKLLPSGSISVFSLKKEKVAIQEELRNRSEFFISNGTFKLTHVELTDSGQYTVEIFSPNGLLLTTKTVELQVVQEYHLPILISASVAGLILIVAVVSCCVCRRTRRHKHQHQSGVRLD